MTSPDTPTARPKAYSYLRFSTPEQSKGDSRRRQASSAVEYAARNGLDLDTELTFQDLGVSAFRGKNVETGALGAFKQAVEDGVVEPGSFLLVESLDRISRNVARKAVRILEDIVERGVTVVTLNDGRQYTSESLDGFDFIMAVLVLIRANEESTTKSRRLKAAWSNKRSRASDKALTRATPAWITVGQDGKCALVESRAKVVRKIIKLALGGTGKEAIARTLNEEGVKNFGSAKFWRRSYIDKMLTSRALVGDFIPHTESHVDGKLVRTPQPAVPGYYPPLLDADEWARLQAVAASSPLRGRHSNAAMQNILSGLARCPKCGGTMTRQVKGERSAPRLVCTTAKSGAGCTFRSVKYAEVEETLLNQCDYIVATLPSPDANVEALLQNAEAVVDAIVEQLSTLADLLERRPSDTLAERLATLEGHLKEARAERDELAARAADTETKTIKLRAAELGVAIRARPLNRRRINAALRALLDRVVVDYTTGYLEFCWRHDGSTSLLYTLPPDAVEKDEAR